MTRGIRRQVERYVRQHAGTLPDPSEWDDIVVTNPEPGVTRVARAPDVAAIATFILDVTPVEDLSWDGDALIVCRTHRYQPLGFSMNRDVVVCRRVCPSCLDTGHVCESHPDKVWDDPRGCSCGAGVPCPTCCDPIPEDDTHSIAEAFTPRHLRPRP